MKMKYKYFAPFGFGIEPDDYVLDLKDGSVWYVNKMTTAGNYDICHMTCCDAKKGGSKRKINIMDYLQTKEDRYIVIPEKTADLFVFGKWSVK